MQLGRLQAEVEGCRKCPLGEQRLRAVFGVGSARARVMFVGEGPGFQEDHEGEPFVGKAGQLLDRILQSIGLSRRTVYIANIVKCHPMTDPSNPELRGNDRPPTPQEAAACLPYIEEQMRLISPRVVVTLGSVATKILLGEDVGITRVRGVWRQYRTRLDERTIQLLPTYHPAALLRNPELKRDVWTDMKNLRKELESLE
ncbi:MAG: uracil-DNA glycosylase [Elusimicrobia bacterium]|nr:uracil-DNA glycosylase [Elusimicrobiota bacterium]